MRKHLITYELIRKYRPCEEGAAHFRTLFPEGAVPTQEFCNQYAQALDFRWAAKNLLTNAEYSRFERLAMAARAEFDDIALPAYAAYNAVHGPAWQQYLRNLRRADIVDAWSVLQKGLAPAQEAQNAALLPALEALDRAIARAFGAIWCQENT